MIVLYRLPALSLSSPNPNNLGCHTYLSKHHFTQISVCNFRNFAVVGILKMGWKKLFLYDKAGSRSEAMVYCLLDFYIHESRQRKGYGKRLIEYMLQVIELFFLIVI